MCRDRRAFLPGTLMLLAWLIAGAGEITAQERSFGAGTAATPRQRGMVQATDVTLPADNVLLGRVIDSDGRVVPNADVLVTHGSQQIGRAVTNADGIFRVTLPHAGLYFVSSGGSFAVARTWVRGTAPPSAVRSILVEPRTIRSQSPMFQNPAPFMNSRPPSAPLFGSPGSATLAAVTGIGAATASAIIFGPDLMDEFTESRSTPRSTPSALPVGPSSIDPGPDDHPAASP